MKKLYVLIIAALASTMVCRAYEHKLVSMKSSVTPEYYTYMYDELNGRIDSTLHYEEMDGMVFDVTYKYVYDENGREIQEKGYQKFTGDDEYTYTMQIHYTYDAQGRLATRTNYNINAERTDFVMGSIYEYIYDDEGRLVGRDCYFDKERAEKFEEGIYEYDEKGRLWKESYYAMAFGDGLTFQNSTEYVYDDNGRMIEKIFMLGDFMTGDAMPAGGEVYTYDAEGNIVEWISYSENKENPSSKEVYTYDTSMDVAQTLYPVENEWDGTVYLNSKNALKHITVYASDWYTGELGLYDEYLLEYSQVSPSGIGTVATGREPMQVACRDGRLYVTGLPDNEPVRLYTMSGTIVARSMNNSASGIDVSGLPTGVYIVSTSRGTAKIFK